MWLLCAALVGASAFPEVSITGNAALPAPVYHQVLKARGLDDGPPTPDRAERIRSAIEDFLKASGYALAEVDAEVTSKGIRIRVDEGRLDRVLFIGAGGGTTLGFQLAFDLPGRVFNQSRVESELERLLERTGFESAEYQVVPVDAPDHRGVQLGPRNIGPLTLIEPGEQHELRIYVQAPPDRPGFDLGLGFRPPDGLYVEADWRFVDVFVDRDRLELDTSIAVDIDELANEPEDRLGITRAYVRARWFTPPLGADWLRSFLLLSASGFGRDRPDIGVDSYIFAPVAASANLEFDFGRFRSYLGAGVERRNILRVRTGTEDGVEPQLSEARLDPPSNTRPFGAFGSRLNLSPNRIRQDRLHSIHFDVRLLAPGDAETGTSIVEIFAGWENTWLFGYNELRTGLVGAYIGGDVPYFNEVAFGDGYLRVAFLDEIFVERILSARTEYRLSLARETFKLSLFNDIAVFDSLDAARQSRGAAVADNVGIGAHLMVLDVFQVDLFTGVGFTTEGDVDVGISLAVEQVF